MIHLRNPQATANNLSLFIHLLLVLGGLLFGRYAVNPETPPLVIDFTLAAVNTAHAETGPPPGGETTMPQPSPVPAPATPPEVRKEPPPKKPVPTPKKVVKPAKSSLKPKSPQPPPAFREEVVTPIPADPAPAQTGTTEPATAAQSSVGEESGSGRAADVSGTPATGGPARSGQGTGEGGGIPYSYEYVRRLIINNLRFPSIARKMGLSGKIVVAFTLKQDGQVADIAITSSSGHAILDDEVAATLRRIAPLPRPPAPARLVVPIVFNLRR